MFSSRNTQKNNFLSPQRTLLHYLHFIQVTNPFIFYSHSTPVRGSENSFSEYFDLRTLLHYLSRLLVRVQVFANGKRKLNAVIVEVGVFRCIQCKTFKNSCCLLFLHLIQFNIVIFEYHIYSIKHCNQCLSLGGLIKKHISQG